MDCVVQVIVIFVCIVIGLMMWLDEDVMEG